MTAAAQTPRSPAGGAAGPGARLGLAANWPQFTLLVLVNVFVGGMVGLERATTSLVGTRVFHLSGYLAIFSFIVAFGVTKAATNLAAGPLSARNTRKALLVAGWAAGVPVPFLLAWAPAWGWIVAANVLLGVNQGLAWSMTVNMKIDLVGPRGRGTAMGLNEAAGYMAVGATALATGYLAAAYGLRPVPELIGVVYVAAGLALSVFVVRDTAAHVAAEAAAHPGQPAAPGGGATPRFGKIFTSTSWTNISLRGASQAGLVNNLNDGLTWGVFPLLFASRGLGLAAIGLIKGVYPLLWGAGQLITGRLSDTLGRKPLIVTGMLVQAAAFPVALLPGSPLRAGIGSAVLLGAGTAMVYPALIASVADHTGPAWRAQGLAVYRFWRDLGYALGAVLAGLVAQAAGLNAAVIAGGVLTFASGLLAARWITGRRGGRTGSARSTKAGGAANGAVARIAGDPGGGNRAVLLTGETMNSAVPDGSAFPGPRVLLLVPARTYRAADFLLAAGRMGLDLVVGSDGALPLSGRPVIPVDPGDPDASVRRILARGGPVDAVVAADTPMLVLAAAVAARLGLPHNPAGALLNAAGKDRQRQRWAAAGVPQPSFRIVPAAATGDAIADAARAVGFPCVVKAVSLSASQGVLRADDPGSAVTAAGRIRDILPAARRPAAEPLLVEEYLSGPELSIDGVLADGDLTVTAVFDKPLTPDGPTFEETLLITPSRLPAPVLAGAIGTAGQAARALGLTRGPIHAELRIDDRGGHATPAMLELAARCIGGLCSRALRFPGGASLEELVLGNALSRPAPVAGRHPARPCGVFMLPVPRPGVLHAVEGRESAAAVPGITGLTITIPVGRQVLPLPDGDQYLGFIFAEADTPGEVQNALTAASGQLRVVIG